MELNLYDCFLLFSGESINKALNDNWKEVLESLKPVISETIAQIGNLIINGFGTATPLAEVFLD